MSTPNDNSPPDLELFNIYEFKVDNHNNKPKIPGYFVISTAQTDVDDPEQTKNQPKQNDLNICYDDSTQPAAKMVQKIADKLIELEETEEKELTTEIIIAVHGFNNKFSATQSWFESIFNYINYKDESISKHQKFVFLGYRWTSEGLFDDRWWARIYDAIFSALPVIPAVLFGLGLLACIALATTWVFLINIAIEPVSYLQNRITAMFNLNTNYWFIGFIVLATFLTILFIMIFTLILLRLVIYFRDTYRATKFGVPDLVELLRQLDKTVFETILFKEMNNYLDLEIIDEIKSAQPEWNKLSTKEVLKIWNDSGFNKKSEIWNKNRGLSKEGMIQDKKRKEKERHIEDLVTENKINRRRVKLTFISHSLGCLVVTDAIRILSDVFDPKSIGNLSKLDQGKLPSPEIGRVFSLGRLVFIAPDIPMETIMPRRANFLRSALRRCEEAYIFSNEGDIALRLASTIANYFSFPAKTRFSGYRLGNITARHFENKEDKYSNFPKQGYQSKNPYGILNLPPEECIYFNEDKFPYDYLEFRSSDKEHKTLRDIRGGKIRASKPIANLFTYFDCTDYKDNPKSLSGKVSFARQKPALNLWGYVILTLAYFSGIVDTHGGYFQGEFSKKTMYKLAFLGFKGLLNSVEGSTLSEQLKDLSEKCERKQIQVVLAPERYEVDILGGERDRSGY